MYDGRLINAIDWSRYPSTFVPRARHDESTSNLVRHVNQCAPSNKAASQAITAYAQGSTYNPSTHRMKIALWVARHNRLFAIIEDKGLLEIFGDLNSKCVTPLANTVSCDVKEIFQMTRVKVAAMLQVRGMKCTELYH